MKTSIYNSIIPITKDSDLLYNSYSDTFVILNNRLRDKFYHPDIIRNEFPDLFNKFIENYIYVNEDKNEFKSLQEQSASILNNQDSFLLIVNPTLDCNFHCWYCYEQHLSDSLMSTDIFNRTKLLIYNIISQNIKTFTLSFFGGEPLLAYRQRVLPLIEYTSNLCKQNSVKFYISFTTNGSLITRSRIEKLSLYGPLKFQITLDGEETTHDKIRFFKNNNGSYSLILRNIKLILTHKHNITLRINYTRDSLLHLQPLILDIQQIPDEYKQYIHIDMHQVWQDKTSINQPDKVKSIANILIKTGFFVTYNNLNEIRNACYGDRKNTAVINFDGNVFKCTAKDFIPQNKEGYLNKDGIIIWTKSQEYRLSLKLKNKNCQSCRIAPLCGGGCSSYILDREKVNPNYCLFNHDSKAIDAFILDRFENHIKIHENL